MSHERVGSFNRRGWKSIAKDEWIVMDDLDNEIGTIKEDNAWLALLRRLMALVIDVNLVPQSYHCEVGGTLACTFKQNFNPFVTKIHIGFNDREPTLRLGHPKLDRWASQPPYCSVQLRASSDL